MDAFQFEVSGPYIMYENAEREVSCRLQDVVSCGYHHALAVPQHEVLARAPMSAY